MTVLQGTLEVFTLPDVFRLLAQNGVTGGLHVVRESGDGVIYFREGEVYFAFSSLTREFLGQRLVNAKLITQGQLLRMLDEQKRSPEKRVGDLLVEKGYISKEMLDTFIKEQIQDAIFNLLQWDMGTFSFQADETSPQEIGLSVSVENLIMENSRRLEEWEVIQRKIPSLDVIVRMSPTPPEDVMEINIKPEEWTLLVLADGVRTVRDIAAATERSEFDACKIIYGLVTAGLLDVASGSSKRSSEEPSRLSPREADGFSFSSARESAPSPSEAQAVPEGEPIPAAPVEEPVSAVAEPETEAVEVAEAEEAMEVVAEELSDVAITESEEETPVPVPSGNGRSEPLRAKVSSSTSSDAKKPGDPTISKEMLLKLIAGVRNL
ncbi:MAG: DUF4388 domain-containing protein [Actinobacteria bacterium]|nr:DUF4388 domain-containing protein [Actinomycetota bacterium]